MEEVIQVRAEAEAVSVGGRRLAGKSNEQWRWARAKEVSIRLRAEAMSGESNAGRGGRRARDDEVIIRCV